MRTDIEAGGGAADRIAVQWRQTIRRRLMIGAGLFLVWSVAIEARLVYLQVVQHAELMRRAERQQSRTIDSAAKRGDIVDRRGRVLAYSGDAETIYAVPSEIDDVAGTAEALCGALGDCSTPARSPQTLAETIRKGKYFAYVRRKATPEQARRVAALDLEGIGFMKEHKRFYPNRNLAAHVLGYVGTDNQGLSGLEATYDSLVKGEAGKVLIQTDARRHAFSRIEKPPTAGASLELTIDQYLQHVAERELSAGIEAQRAVGGAAVVMDPATGEILAMANYPSFNPNAYRQADADQLRNRAVQDLYEPGSTFKIFTAAAALQEQKVRPDDPIDVSAGAIRFGSRVIEDDHRYGVLPFRGVIAKSSNVGSIKVGLKVGPERFGHYVRSFGFGRRLSPDFPGESPGIVWNPAQLDDSALASMLIGYQVGVTALQMATAVSAVANGGDVVQPRVVRAVIRNGERTVVPRKVLGQAVNAGTAAELREILEGVTQKGGTATRAHVEGFTAAGKTGTANKLIDRAYSPTDYNASFVGFIPSRDPIFTIVVMVHARKPGGHYGGIVAAPIFQRIAAEALRYQGVPRTIDPPPALLVERRDGPRERPTSGPVTPPIVTLAGTENGSVFPDLRGMSARDAVRALARLGLTARVRGTGMVTEQQPAAGTAIESDVTATLWLARYPAADPQTERAAPVQVATHRNP